MKPLLRVEGACKTFGHTRALQGMSLELFAGELLGLLGPNGAGKTTLIRCLCGRSRLDAGEIHFADAARRDQRLGVVPQSLAIYEDLTAEQNLRAFGRLHGLRGNDLATRIDSALDWANLSDRRRQLARCFSGGMKRRLNIACAVLHQPRILLLDEPTVGVDPQSRERIYEMLVDLQQQGTAILLTTHQLDEAQYRCSRIVIVDGGRTVRSGTLTDLVQDTIGSRQQLTIRFPARPDHVPAPLKLDPQHALATGHLNHAVTELPVIMKSLAAAGLSVEQIVLQSPTLQQVFLHLTGKELRE